MTGASHTATRRFALGFDEPHYHCSELQWHVNGQHEILRCGCATSSGVTGWWGVL